MEVLLFALFFISALIFFIAGKDDFGRTRSELKIKEEEKVKSEVQDEGKVTEERKEEEKVKSEVQDEGKVTEERKEEEKVKSEVQDEGKVAEEGKEERKVTEEGNIEPKEDGKKEP